METTNLSGQKLSKNDLQIHLLGNLDELNAYLGLIKAKLKKKKEKTKIETIQNTLMKIMSHISNISDNNYRLKEEDVSNLINEIRKLKSAVTKTNKKYKESFVLPGKNEIDAYIHITRTVTRRAERYYTAVNEQTPLCQNSAEYLNRLSEYLFYLSFTCRHFCP